MRDPIIDEVRKARAKVCAPFGHDVSALGAYLRKEQKKYKDRLVSFADKKPTVKAT
jgi:hypothetical protein